MRVYLDNAATTKIDKEVLAEMMPYMEEHYGNPSSIHSFGRETRSKIEKGRKRIADMLKCSPSELFFTSAGTEGNNTILRGCVNDLGVTDIISSETEHHCVLHTLEALKAEGLAEIHYVKLNDLGHFDLEDLDAQLKALNADGKKVLISLMHSNNEIGTMMDIKKVGQIAEANDAFFHSDTVQTLGKFPIDLQDINIHFITGSAHKFHGPKGVGMIYINGDVKIKPFIHGGAQERNMRAGTENMCGIIGLAKAFELAVEKMEENSAYILDLKKYMIEKLRADIPGVQFNGDAEGDSNYILLNVSFPSFSNKDMMLFNLDIMGVAASSGSACSSGSSIGSHVLKAINSDPERTSIRFSFSKYNTKEEIDFVLEKVKEIYAGELVG